MKKERKSIFLSYFLYKQRSTKIKRNKIYHSSYFVYFQAMGAAAADVEKMIYGPNSIKGALCVIKFLFIVSATS